MCRLLWLVLKTVKDEVERDSPGAVLGSRLRLPGPRSEDRAGGDREPVVRCRPDTDHLVTIEQTDEDSSCVFDQQPHHRWVSPSQFLPLSRPYLARLGFVSPGLLFSGCALLLCFLPGD